MEECLIDLNKLLLFIITRNDKSPYKYVR